MNTISAQMKEFYVQALLFLNHMIYSGKLELEDIPYEVRIVSDDDLYKAAIHHHAVIAGGDVTIPFAILQSDITDSRTDADTKSVLTELVGQQLGCFKGHSDEFDRFSAEYKQGNERKVREC